MQNGRGEVTVKTSEAVGSALADTLRPILKNAVGVLEDVLRFEAQRREAPRKAKR